MREEIKSAITHIRHGDAVAARLQLINLLKDEPNHADAWVLLAHLTSDSERKLSFLNKALALQPDHPFARKELSKLAQLNPQSTSAVQRLAAQGNGTRLPGSSRQDRTGKLALSEPTFVVDEMVERWLSVLDYPEHHVLRLLYGLEGELLSTKSIKGSLETTIQIDKPENLKETGLAKLRRPSSRDVIAPLMNLVRSLMEGSGRNELSHDILDQLRRTVDTAKYDFAAVIRLLVEVEVDATSLQRPSEPPEAHKTSVSFPNISCTSDQEASHSTISQVHVLRPDRSTLGGRRTEELHSEQRLVELPYVVDWTLADSGNEGQVSELPDLVEIFFEDVKRLPIISNRSQQFWLGAQLQAPARLRTLRQPRTVTELAQATADTYTNIIELSARLELQTPRVDAWIAELRFVHRDIYRLQRSRPRRFLRQLHALNLESTGEVLEDEIYKFVELLCLIPEGSLRRLSLLLEEKTAFPIQDFITALAESELQTTGELNEHAGQVRDRAIAILSVGFLRYGLRIARNYIGRNVDYLDLVQEAFFGLLRAAAKYQYREHGQFSHYGTNWIWQHVTRAIAVQGRTVRLPVHTLDQMAALEKAEQEISAGYSTQPMEISTLLSLGFISNKEAEQLAHWDSKKRLPPELVRKHRRAQRKVERLRQWNCHPFSLSEPAPTLEDESELHGEWVELLADRLTDQKSAEFENEISIKALRQRLVDLVASAARSERDYKIILHRYGFADGEEHTLQETGAKFGLTRERVRQIEARTLKAVQGRLGRQDVLPGLTAAWLDSWLVDRIGLHPGTHFRAREVVETPNPLEPMWIDELLNELPRGEYGQWKSGATRDELLRDALLAFGTITHYHDLHESIQEEATTMPLPAVYQVMLNNDKLFVPLGEGYFSLMEWETQRAKGCDPILPFTPLPLPDPPGYENAFFEAVLVAHKKLTRSPLTAPQFIKEMLAWCAATEDVPKWRKHSYLSAFYAAGLIPYTSYLTDSEEFLESHLPNIPIRELREYCLKSVTKRVVEMPLFWWLLDAYAPARPIELGQLLSDFHSQGIDDSRNRLSLLAGLGAVRRLTYGRYELTPLGKVFADRFGSHSRVFEQVHVDSVRDEDSGFTAIIFD